MNTCFNTQCYCEVEDCSKQTIDGIDTVSDEKYANTQDLNNLLDLQRDILEQINLLKLEDYSDVQINTQVKDLKHMLEMVLMKLQFWDYEHEKTLLVSPNTDNTANSANPANTVDNEFELVISYVPDGLGTNYLWKNVEVGSKITMRGPLGVFTLPEVIDEDICFICTGTGIAPFRSMSKWLGAHPEVQRKNVYLLFGCRTQEDLLYPDEFLDLQHKMPNFTYVRCCSRENPETFKGHVGYVHPVYEKLFEDKRPVKFYLCGWRNMIDEAKQRIVAMGYDRKAVHVEIYG